MKKSFLIGLFAALAFTVQAQRAALLPLVLGDTIVNTGTVTKTLPALTAGYNGLILQMNLTKLSGTGAGTVQLQTSLDGVNWVNSGSAFTITNVASQAALFTITAPVPVYCRLLCTGSGTESVQTNTYYLARLFATTVIPK